MNQKSKAISVSLVFSFLGFSFSALAADPLVYGNNLTYLGAIKVPGGDFGLSTLSYGGQVITYNQNSLFITGNGQAQRVAEISLPAPVMSARLAGSMPILASDLPTVNTARVIQNFADITDGKMKNVAWDGSAVAGTVQIGGLLKWRTGLVGTVFTFYDGANVAKRSHFTSDVNLSITNDCAGIYKVGAPPDTPTASFVSGFISHVPDNSGTGGSNWQTLLGGSAITGNGTLSILSRTSFGPAAFSFNPDRLGIDEPVFATPLLYYPQAYATLGPDGVAGESNSLFNATTKISGMVMIPGSRSVLYFGYHGIGPYSYGDWTANPDAVVPGQVYYDPSGMGSKGPHAYPYIYQVWAYDAYDLSAAKTGKYAVTQTDFASGRFVEGVYPNIKPLPVGQTVKPWNVKPYASWKLPFNFAYTQIFGGGAAYDPATRRLFISEPGAVKYGCCEMLPLIHVFQVDLSEAAANTLEPGYSIGGTAMLLKGSVILRNNSADDLTVSASDRTTVQSFAFPTSVSSGGRYDVTVYKQPVGQKCTVFNGTGTVNSKADIANIVLSCTNVAAVSPPTNLRATSIK